jgi:hypothetical protein
VQGRIAGAWQIFEKSGWGAAPDPEVFLKQRKMGLVLQPVLPDDHSMTNLTDIRRDS